MKKEMYGEVIRFLRQRQGFTQEELADGICSVSTLSRIECGSRAPSRDLFDKLMEKLGEPGFLYGECGRGNLVELGRLKEEALRAAKEGDFERMEEKVFALERMREPEDKETLQLICLLQLIACMSDRKELPTRDLIESCRKAFCLTRGSAEPETFSKRRMSYLEMLIQNNIGILYMEQNDDLMAWRIFESLYIQAVTGPTHNEKDYRCRAALCNNLALLAIRRKDLDRAADFCEKGLALSVCGIGMDLLLSLMGLHMVLCREAGDTEGYYSDLCAIKAILRMICSKGRKLHGTDPFEPKPIRIF